MRQSVQALRAMSAVLAILFARSHAVRAAAEDGAGAAPPPPEVTKLLEAQGRIEAAAFLAATLSPAQRDTCEAQQRKARGYALRVYPACCALLATGAEERVCAALRDSFQVELASALRPERTNGAAALAPLYPAAAGLPGELKAGYGRVLLIDPNPLVWATPALWNGAPETPSFAGWSIETNAIRLTKSASALVRSDFRIDDAEVTGDVCLEDGDAIFLILRSDVVVKFHPGKARGSEGNLNVKFGYDNLKTASRFFRVPEIAPGRPYPFRFVLEGQTLAMAFDGKDVATVPVAGDPRLKGSKVARAGYFGFGSAGGSGSFGNVAVQALTPAGKRRLPRLVPPTSYAPAGAEVRMLEGPGDEFVSLSHATAGAYKPAVHSISNGVLSLKGGPYTQFSRKGIAADDFIARGRMRFLDKGSVWFRVNSGLLFGVRCDPANAPFAVKHSTANFNVADEEQAGAEVNQGQWYPWEIEYHDPAGVLRLDGKVAMVALTPAPGGAEKAGTNQLGISAYNTAAGLRTSRFRSWPGAAAATRRRRERCSTSCAKACAASRKWPKHAGPATRPGRGWPAPF